LTASVRAVGGGSKQFDSLDEVIDAFRTPLTIRHYSNLDAPFWCIAIQTKLKRLTTIHRVATAPDLSGMINGHRRTTRPGETNEDAAAVKYVLRGEKAAKRVKSDGTVVGVLAIIQTLPTKLYCVTGEM
jgi:hypothetical protein